MDQRDGPAQGEHVGDEQVDDEGLETGAVLQRAGHVVGEPAPGPGPAAGAFLDLGVHAALDDLEHDVVQDAALASDGADAGQVGAAGVAGLDFDRLLDDGLPKVVARLQVRLRALAAVPAAAPRGLVLLRLRRRQAGVPARLAGRPFQQDGDHDVQQGEQDADDGIDLFGDLAVLPQFCNARPGVIELLAQRRAVHRRHHPASTAMTAASTARRSA